MMTLINLNDVFFWHIFELIVIVFDSFPRIYKFHNLQSHFFKNHNSLFKIEVLEFF
jgi:hypothetical protein